MPRRGRGEHGAAGAPGPRQAATRRAQRHDRDAHAARREREQHQAGGQALRRAYQAARRGGLDVRLKVAGGVDPTVRAQAQRRIDEAGLAEVVEFLGAYNSKQAPAIYRSAGAYLMTKNNDPCPNSVLEAMASGLPVLYSASGGVPELVGAEAGIGLAVPESFEEDVVPDPVAIAEGMSRIIRQQRECGAAARRRAVERFDLPQWLARHDAVFEQALRNAA